MPYNQRRRRRRYRLKPVPIFIALLIVVAFIVFIVSLFNKDDPKIDKDSKNSSQQASLDPSSTAPSSDAPSSSEADPSSADPSSDAAKDNQSSDTTDADPAKTDAASDSEWNLLLLNSTTPALEKDMEFEKTQFDTQYIDSRVAPAYKSMCEAAKADGITLYLRSGYRSIATQTTNYNAAVERYKKTNTAEEAIRLADQYYARPGKSEHHTGLALDIITPEYHKTVYTLDEQFVETKAYDWLVKHCSDYGFILRYPKDKVDVTKINYEPWHYRYVGVDAARYITKNNICLEEYNP